VLSTGGETLRVLVVEDDRDTAETLRTLLDLCGCCVVVAHTSQQGIEAARRLEPHIVLCDIGLPDADGTGFGEPQHRRRALAAGFDQHLVKPVDPKVLLHELQVIH
jgi:CheY-like chemotaxis protein